MNTDLLHVINTEKIPLSDAVFITKCKKTLDINGALVLPNYLKKAAIESINSDAEKQRLLAYYTNGQHNIYLTESDPQFDNNHVRNRLMSSSKGCITTDQIPSDSALKIL